MLGINPRPKKRNAKSAKSVTAIASTVDYDPNRLRNLLDLVDSGSGSDEDVRRSLDVLYEALDPDAPLGQRQRALRLMAFLCDNSARFRKALNGRFKLLSDVAKGEGVKWSSIDERSSTGPSAAALSEAGLRTYALRLVHRLCNCFGRSDMPAAATASLLLSSKRSGGTSVVQIPPLDDEEIPRLPDDFPLAVEAHSVSSAAETTSSAHVSAERFVARLQELDLLADDGHITFAPSVFSSSDSPLLQEAKALLNQAEQSLAVFDDDDDDDDDEDDEKDEEDDALAYEGEGGDPGDDEYLCGNDDDEERWEDVGSNDCDVVSHSDDTINLKSILKNSSLSSHGKAAAPLQDLELDIGPSGSGSAAAAVAAEPTNASIQTIDPSLLEPLRDALKPLLRRILPKLHEAAALCDASILESSVGSSSASSSAASNTAALQQALRSALQPVLKRASRLLERASALGIDIERPFAGTSSSGNKSTGDAAASSSSADHKGAVGGDGSGKKRKRGGKAAATGSDYAIPMPHPDSAEAQRASLDALLARQDAREAKRANAAGQQAPADMLAYITRASAGDDTAATSSSADGGDAAAATAGASDSLPESRTGDEPKQEADKKKGEKTAKKPAPPPKKGFRVPVASHFKGGPAERLRKALAAQKRTGGQRFEFLHK